MTGYEMVLLARAVETVFRQDATIGIREIDGRVVVALTRLGEPISDYFGSPTLADALTALLRDLGVDVPEPPSAERVAEAEIDTAVEDAHGDPFYSLSDLRDLYAREPQTVLALLEGGAS